MSYYPAEFVIHFDTLHPYSAGVTPVEHVAIEEVRRAIYGAFTGITIDGTITPNVDYTEGGTHTTITGVSKARETLTRVNTHRLYPIIGEAPPSLGSETPIVVDSGPFTTFSDITKSTETDDPPGTSSDVQLAAVRGALVASYSRIGFLRDGSQIGLHFFSWVSTVAGAGSTDDAPMYIYAPVAGASPEDFYDFPSQPPDNPPYSYTAIPEADAGTLLGVTLKKAGWKRTVARAVGTEEYTPGISLAEI